MRHSTILTATLALGALLPALALQAEQEPITAEPGASTPPAPELLAPGVLSSRQGEFSPTLDPSRGELVFMRRTPGRFDYTLYVSRRVEGRWSEPEPLPFSGDWRDGGPSFVPDGSALLFDSRRPAEGLEPRSINVWRAERREKPESSRQGGAWRAPRLVRAASVNPRSDDRDQADEFGPFEDAAGDLYFYSFRVPDRGGRHYVLSDSAEEPRHADQLPDPSADTFVGYTTLNPEGSIAIIEGRAPGRRDTDLFLYRKDESGRWGDRIDLPSVNTRWGDGTPSITSDGSTLLFASTRPTGDGRTAASNLYSIDLAELLAADAPGMR